MIGRNQNKTDLTDIHNVHDLGVSLDCQWLEIVNIYFAYNYYVNARDISDLWSIYDDDFAYELNVQF